MDESGTPPIFTSLSKRAARRLIQRAFVLAGRERHLRQRLREAGISTRWVLKDWDFSWTVNFDRGRVYFERRPAKRPDAELIWSNAEEFFNNIESGKSDGGDFEWIGDAAHRRLLGAVLQTFGLCLREVIRNPVDENGVPLN